MIKRSIHHNITQKKKELAPSPAQNRHPSSSASNDKKNSHTDKSHNLYLTSVPTSNQIILTP